MRVLNKLTFENPLIKTISVLLNMWRKDHPGKVNLVGGPMSDFGTFWGPTKTRQTDGSGALFGSILTYLINGGVLRRVVLGLWCLPEGPKMGVFTN